MSAKVEPKKSEKNTQKKPTVERGKNGKFVSKKTNKPENAPVPVTTEKKVTPKGNEPVVVFEGNLKDLPPSFKAFLLNEGILRPSQVMTVEQMDAALTNTKRWNKQLREYINRVEEAEDARLEHYRNSRELLNRRCRYSICAFFGIGILTGIILAKVLMVALH